MSNITAAAISLGAIAQGDKPAAVAAPLVTSIATAVAMNGGALNSLRHVITCAQTTRAGKPRTPAAGTVAALIVTIMQRIEREAPDSGARKGPEDARTPAQRQELAGAFGAAMAEAFLTSAAVAAEARKAKAAEAKAAREAEGTTGGTTGDAAEGGTEGGGAGVDEAGAAAVGVDWAARARTAHARAARYLRDLRRVRAELRAMKAAQAAVSAARKGRKGSKAVDAVSTVDVVADNRTEGVAHELAELS